MITLYESNITSFPLDNGIGVLSDAISSVAKEEINGLFELKIEYDSEGFLADVIKEEMIIKAKANDKQDEQLFRIYSITKNHENDNLIIDAQHITYDLGNNFVEKLEARSLTKRQVMELIGSSTQYPHPFNVTSSNNSTRSSTSLYRTNPLQMIGGIEGSVLQIWGGQIERDNFNLILHDRRGSDDGVKVLYKKNLTGLTAKFDIENLVTRIFPYVYIPATDEDPEQLITVPGKYIDSPYIDNYEMPYILPVDYSYEDGIETSQDLLNMASNWFTETGRDKPKVNMEVQFEHLWETEEYKDVAALELVGMGDTITVEHSKLKVEGTAIVNRIEYDVIARKNIAVDVGHVKARFTDKVNDVSNVIEKVEQAEQSANQAIRTANGKNTIYYGPDEPTGNHSDGDLWFRVVDGEYTRTYRFDGIQWQLVVSKDVKDIEEVANTAHNRADQAVANANIATGNALEAIGIAQEGFDKAQDALTTAEGAKDLATTLTAEMTTISEMVDDHTGEISTISQSVQGLQNSVSDAQGNASNALQIAMGLQTTVSDIEGNVGTLQQTAINLTSRFDNLQIGGRNYFLHDLLMSFRSANTYGDDSKGRWYEFAAGAGNLTKVGVFEENTEYTLSFELENSSASNTRLVIEYTDGTNIQLYSSQSFTTPKDKTVSHVRITYSTSGGRIRLYNPMFVKGNVPTDWSSAPEDADQKFSAINQTIDDIATRVQTTEDDYSSLSQTVSGFQTTVSNMQGDLSTVTQLANTNQTNISNAQGDINTLTQTASSLDSTIKSVRDDLDAIERYNIVAVRYNNSGFAVYHKYSGLYKDDGTVLWGLSTGNDRSYTLSIYDRNSKTWDSHTRYDVYTSSTNDSLNLAEKLNSLDNDKLIVLVGAHAPARNRLSNGLPEAIYRCGGSRDVFETADWEGNYPSYILIGIPGMGEGVGKEYFSPASGGWLDVQLIINNGNVDFDGYNSNPISYTQSQFTQLSNNINARVEKGDVINQINISTEDILISGKKLILDGDTTVTGTFRVANANITSVDAGKLTTGELDAGKVTLINLVGLDIYGSRFRSSTGTDFMEITGGNIRLQNANNRYLEMSPTGFYGYNAGGDVRFQADQSLVTSAALGTTNLNVYLAAGDGDQLGEVRAVRRDTIPGGGSAADYSYINMRARAFKSPPTANAYIGTDGELRVMSEGLAGSGVYRNVRANKIFANEYETRGDILYLRSDSRVRIMGTGDSGAYSDLQLNYVRARAIVLNTDLTANNFYVGTGSGELRVTSNGLSDGIYTTVRAGGFVGAFLDYRGSGSHLYARPDTGGELRVTRIGTTNVYQDIRANHAYMSGVTASDNVTANSLTVLGGGLSTNSVDTRTGNNLYIRANTEVRATAPGTTDVYIPVKADSFPTGSSEIVKSNISRFEGSALELLNNSVIYDYTRKSSGIRELGFIIEREMPSIVKFDDTSVNGYTHRSLNTKAIQELDAKVDDELSILRDQYEQAILKIADLEARLNKQEAA